MDINLRRKGWLIPLMRSVLAGMGPPEVGGDESFEAWSLTRMRQLGFYFGTALETPSDHEGLGREIFLDKLRRQIELLRDARHFIGGGGDPALLPLEIAAVMARAEGLFDEAEAIEELRDDLRDGQDVSGAAAGKRLRGPVRALGTKLLAHKLDDDHPLLDSPFHRLLIYCDTRLLSQIAQEAFSAGRVRELRCIQLIGQTQVQKLYFVEAIIGLSWANGTIDPMEHRLIKALIEIGQFTSEERTMLWQCLDDDPPRPEEIARGVEDPINRRFLLEQVLFSSFVDGEVSPEEDAYIKRLAEVFAISPQRLAQLQLEVIEAMETSPDLLRGLSLSGILNRMRKHTQKQVEDVIRDNLGALKTEVGETAELARLLAKSTRAKLSPEEQERARAQLIDICKTIPSLALLVAPGGSILVPILMKTLPFSMLPSAFDEKDETF